MNPIGKLFIATHVGLFRLTGGRIGASMFGGRVMVLTTTGSKTGKRRSVPVMYFEHDGSRFVVASYGGSPEHPAWFKNMRRNPDVTVEVPGRKYSARAEVIAGEERARVWQQVTGEMSRFSDYEHKTQGKREIPIVKLVEAQPS